MIGTVNLNHLPLIGWKKLLENLQENKRKLLAVSVYKTPITGSALKSKSSKFQLEVQYEQPKVKRKKSRQNEYF